MTALWEIETGVWVDPSRVVAVTVSAAYNGQFNDGYYVRLHLVGAEPVDVWRYTRELGDAEHRTGEQWRDLGLPKGQEAADWVRDRT